MKLFKIALLGSMLIACVMAQLENGEILPDDIEGIEDVA